MKQRTILLLGVVVVSLSFGLLFCKQNTENTENLTSIRIGWQTVWATQGQVIQALQHTDLMKRNGLQGQFIPFPSGSPAVEAALSGSLDVISGGSQPILQLIANSSDWVIVSRHAYVRLGILVPPESNITKLADVKGQAVGVALGSTAERFVLIRAKEAGLNARDIRFIHIGIEEQAEFVRAGNRQSWGTISALSTWEPTVSILERKGLGRVIQEENEITLTAMSKKFIQQHNDAAIAYLRATILAWHYYSAHRAELNQQYLKAAQLPLDNEMLEKIATNEPNSRIGKPEEVDISLTPEIMAGLQKTSDFLYDLKRLARKLMIQDVVDLTLLQKAKATLTLRD